MISCNSTPLKWQKKQKFKIYCINLFHRINDGYGIGQYQPVSRESGKHLPPVSDPVLTHSDLWFLRISMDFYGTPIDFNV